MTRRMSELGGIILVALSALLIITAIYRFGYQQGARSQRRHWRDSR